MIEQRLGKCYPVVCQRTLKTTYALTKWEDVFTMTGDNHRILRKAYTAMIDAAGEITTDSDLSDIAALEAACQLIAYKLHKMRQERKAHDERAKRQTDSPNEHGGIVATSTAINSTPNENHSNAGSVEKTGSASANNTGNSIGGSGLSAGQRGNSTVDQGGKRVKGGKPRSSSKQTGGRARTNNAQGAGQ